MMRSRSRWKAGRIVVFGLGRAGGPACRRSWPPAARGSRARAASSCFADACRSSTRRHRRHLARGSSCRARSGADAEHLGQRLPEVGEGRARAEVDARRARARPATSSGTYSREWSVLGVVGSLPWSAVTTSRSSGAQPRQQRRRAARRSARGSRRSRPTSLRWPYCVSKSTRLAKISPRGVVAIARSTLVHPLVVARRVDARA